MLQRNGRVQYSLLAEKSRHLSDSEINYKKGGKKK